IVEIRPQGILSGSKDCPESSNVVVIFKNEEPIYYDRIDFNQKREDFSITTITSLAKMKEFLFNFLLDVDTADSFTDEFKSYTLTANEYTKSVSGGIDKLGTGVIAVAVSEEFVDAMRYSPAEHSEPRITAINTADEIKTGNKGILRVMIENRNDNTGLVEVEPIATNLAFTPRMREVTLDGAGSVGADFTFQAGKIFEDTPTEICVDVTSLGSQFGGSNTDRYCKTITITKEQSEDEPYCGDGTCQPDLGETYSSCPADCTGLNLCVDIDNSEPNWLGKCVCIEGYNPIIEGGQLSCKADKDYTPYFILGGLAFAGFLFMLLVIVIAIQFKKK
ncbi:MAG: hypothetical protein KAS32_18590, partial [Candidatus Peribacteraceae bacterium]|nr:hypothetical protein [Candidatus Peribacteraceae bacterium]